MNIEEKRQAKMAKISRMSAEEMRLYVNEHGDHLSDETMRWLFVRSLQILASLDSQRQRLPSE